MVDRSRIGSEGRRGWKALLALLAIVAASIGGSLGTSAISDFAEHASLPWRSDDDVVVVESGGSVSSDAVILSGRGALLRDRAGSESSPTLWHWSGASPGPARTVYLSIDTPVYPIGGLRWYFNGAADRNDIYGPLDDEFGLWHSSTRDLVAGDVVSACWIARDGVERCPEIVIQ